MHIDAGMKKAGRRRNRTDKAAASEAEVLRPAVRIDANYLRAMAERVRKAVSEVLMPPLLEELEAEARKGRLQAGIWLKDLTEGLRMDSLSVGEAMVAALLPLGFQARLAEMERGRLGLQEVEIMLQITWREVAG